LSILHHLPLLTLADVSALKIPQQILNEMIAHARELAPYECCGLLAGKDGGVTHHYRIKNIVAQEGAEELSSFDEAKASHLKRLSPQERAEIAFIMDMYDFSLAKKDMRAQGTELQIVYHSHPHSPARPSVTDIKIATEYEDIWGKINLAEPLYMILSLQDTSKPDIRAYFIKEQRVTSAEFTVI
jgi:[CysO sulfur-carrier protein]-S-L-cysteine hydrolase